jgi:hypothetical protein
LLGEDSISSVKSRRYYGINGHELSNYIIESLNSLELLKKKEQKKMGYSEDLK